jgi:hypothetical protein
MDINATFEDIRKELKPFNADENEAPPKLLVAGEKDILEFLYQRKRNSQFLICIKQFNESEHYLVGKLLDELTIRTGKKPLAFYYNDENALITVIEDFKDYYNMELGDNLIQKISSSVQDDKSQFCMIIFVLESWYYR